MNATTAPKRTRHERKMARNALLARLEQDRAKIAAEHAEWCRQHPILSGAIPITDYREPVWFAQLGKAKE